MSLLILHEFVFILNVSEREIFKTRSSFPLLYLYPYKIIESSGNLYLGGLYGNQLDDVSV